MPGGAASIRRVRRATSSWSLRGASVEGALDGANDDVIFFSAVAVPGHCTGEPLTNAETTFDSFVAFITKHPHLIVKDVRDVSVGGLDGKVMDLGIDDIGDGCDGNPMSTSWPR